MFDESRIEEFLGLNASKIDSERSSACCLWVLYRLAENQKTQRVKWCRKMTGDEIWRDVPIKSQNKV